jgi:hypothetical protein
LATLTLTEVAPIKQNIAVSFNGSTGTTYILLILPLNHLELVSLEWQNMGFAYLQNQYQKVLIVIQGVTQ